MIIFLDVLLNTAYANIICYYITIQLLLFKRYDNNAFLKYKTKTFFFQIHIMNSFFDRTSRYAMQYQMKKNYILENIFKFLKVL